MSDRFGVVLGAGGVLGASWTIGALRAFELTTGRDPRAAELLIGTSAGSILAAFLACGVGTDTMANHQQGISVEGDPAIGYDYDTDSGGPLPPWPRLRIGSAELLVRAALRPWTVTPLAALTSVLPQGRGSLAPVAAMVDTVAPAGPAAWAPHPRTWIVAMDYQTGRRVPFGRVGSPTARLATAVTASCAIPGWYPPVRVGDRRYVDGGTRSSTSADLAVGEDLDELIVIAPMVSVQMDSPRSVPARIERLVRRRFTRRLLKEVAAVQARGTRVTILGPGPEDLEAIGANLMDPRRRERVFDTSLRTSAAALAPTADVPLVAAG